tara:strand:- start:1784 stop:2164 length:381 start_codon:yes stop_codon:yes gene_type:complete
MWRETAYLVHGEEVGADERSALEWIKSYVNKSNSGCDVTGPVLSVEFEEIGFDFYPNPVKGGSYIRFSEDEILKNIRLRSMNGEILIFKDINSKEGNIQINLNRGMYILEVLKENDRHVFKKLIVR